MCCTGLCQHENYAGECTLPGAACVAGSYKAYQAEEQPVVYPFLDVPVLPISPLTKALIALGALAEFADEAWKFGPAHDCDTESAEDILLNWGPPSA